MGAIAALAWGLFWPVRVSAVAPRRAVFKTPVERADAPAKAALAAGDWARLWSKALRRPLVDKPIATTQEAKKAVPSAPPNVVLVGTMVEAGHSKAMFATTNGVLELRGIGETVGGAPGGPEVVEIESNRVVLRHRGELMTVRLKGGDEG